MLLIQAKKYIFPLFIPDKTSVVSCVKWRIWFSGIGRVDKTPKACIHRFLVDSRYALNPPYKKQHITARHILRDATLLYKTTIEPRRADKTTRLANAVGKLSHTRARPRSSPAQIGVACRGGA